MECRFFRAHRRLLPFVLAVDHDLYVHPRQVSVEQLAVNLVKTRNGLSGRIQIIQKVPELTHAVITSPKRRANRFMAHIPDGVTHVLSKILSAMIAIPVEVESHLAVKRTVDREDPIGRYIDH